MPAPALHQAAVFFCPPGRRGPAEPVAVEPGRTKSRMRAGRSRAAGTRAGARAPRGRRLRQQRRQWGGGPGGSCRGTPRARPGGLCGAALGAGRALAVGGAAGGPGGRGGPALEAGPGRHAALLQRIRGRLLLRAGARPARPRAICLAAAQARCPALPASWSARPPAAASGKNASPPPDTLVGRR